jgi:tetratricopeptide (TPR) repeat protein
MWMRETMLIAMLLAAAGAAPPPPDPAADPSEAGARRYAACLRQAREIPQQGIAAANAWRIEGGGIPARHCLAIAELGAENYTAAVADFRAAAVDAEAAHHPLAPALWAQAGNAALLAGKPDAAIDLLSTAIAEAQGADKAEPLIDRARAYVEMQQPDKAAADLARATTIAPDIGLGWLLKATLARQSGDLKTAEAAIVEAGKREPDSADVMLEAGNIAAAKGDAKLARQAWQAAADAAPDSAAGKAAAKALAGAPAG